METIKNYRILALILFGVIVLLLLLQKYDNKETGIVTTPEVKGTLHDTIEVTYTKIAPVEKIIVKNVPYEVVREVTIEGETIYVNQIDTLRTQAFTKSSEDDKLKVTASGIVTGEINDIKFDYTIKPQTIEYKKDRVKRFGIGLQSGYGIDGKIYVGAGLTYNLFTF